MSVTDGGRVIAGTARGRRLVAPGPGTRPLSDRVKQTLFAVLEPSLRGARFLDLFAGSGAGGIEALSRGASSAVFVERNRGVVQTIEENLRRTGLSGGAATVVRAEVGAWLALGLSSSGKPFNLVLIDPPYEDTDALAAALAGLGDPGLRWLAPAATVVAKHFWRAPPGDRAGLLRSVDVRRFGETTLTFYRTDDEFAAGAHMPGEAEAE